MGKTNAAWHASNRMLRNATDRQRIEWHQRHAEQCQCRPIPNSILELMQRGSEPLAAGYSGKSLAEKLGFKPGLRVRLIDAPVGLQRLLTTDVQFQRSISKSTELVHLFVTSKAALERQLASLRAKLRPDAVVWVSWPKKSANVPTDVTEGTIRAVALPLGWVDIKVCAVDATWSGLKLVVRKELR
jgi:hypothetical protein